MPVAQLVEQFAHNEKDIQVRILSGTQATLEPLQATILVYVVEYTHPARSSILRLLNGLKTNIMAKYKRLHESGDIKGAMYALVDEIEKRRMLGAMSQRDYERWMWEFDKMLSTSLKKSETTKLYD